ncbi:hypothetical protein [Photobacterium leiognathi]|uniref:hypothetical protein n=1 Tax=Photobacterium leiognathi TaxID=553611 RepID=UPI002981264B|nr:hypothetical protein [Photobacterium leiognathi]
MISIEKEESLIVKYNNAVSKKYYLEAIALIFHLIELRSRSVITTFSKEKPGKKVKIKKSMNRIKKNRKRIPSLGRHFQNDFINQLLDWKRLRDDLMHQLVKDDLENINVEKLAADGLSIYDEFSAIHLAWLAEYEANPSK